MIEIKACRACKSDELIPFLDLGEHYLSDFRGDKTKTSKYPIVAALCNDCKLVQLMHTTPQEEMYHERYGFKSGISNSIKDDLNNAVTHAFQYVSDPKTWLDIASNDGTLLSFVPNDVYKVGVDPVKFLCEEAKPFANDIINDYFTLDTMTEYRDLLDNGWGFDVVTSISCFYDMPDPSQFVSDVKATLAKRGVWLIQQNYLLTTLQLNAVDNFCHEHIEYYTLLSLENLLDRFGLEVNEVTTSPVNGGSIRTIVSRRGTFPIDESVQKQRQIEIAYGLDNVSAYRRFARDINYELVRLNELINSLQGMGKRIAVLAASTRGATIWQAAGLTSKNLVYAIERNPAKVGKRFSAIGIPIVSEEFARKDNPDFMLIGPWFYADEIMAREHEYARQGGKFIIPLPEVRII